MYASSKHKRAYVRVGLGIAPRQIAAFNVTSHHTTPFGILSGVESLDAER